MTGTKSSAAGGPLSQAMLSKFTIVVAQRNTHCSLSRGVLYADIVAISACAEGQGHSYK